MRTRAGKSAAAAAAAALLAGSLLAAPSVEITNVQQQYPWTNTVDITYTVQGVNKTHQTNRLDHIVNDTYFATFEAKNGNTPIQDVNGNTVFTNGLVQGNGTFTAQWQPKTDLQLTGCTMTPSVFRGEENAYLVVNLETNKQGKCDWWYEPMSTQEDSNKRYNTEEYKTKKMVFRRISPGQYINGDAKHAGAVAYGGNSPHQVVVPEDGAYYLAIFMTTVAQYNQIMSGNIGDTLDLTPVRNTYAAFRNSALPSASITGDKDNQTSIIVKLAGMSNLNIDLPTEEMWEIAARAGTTTLYFWGDTVMSEYFWYNSNSGNKLKQVGTRLPNQWGFYDMLGLNFEWCRDGGKEANDLVNKTSNIYTVSLSHAGTPNRVRGGSYGYSPLFSECSHRNASYSASYSPRIAIYPNAYYTKSEQ